MQLSCEYGCGPEQLLHSLRRHGMRVRSRQLNFHALNRELRQNHPVIVGLQYPNASYGHWATLYGLSSRARQVWLSNPGWAVPPDYWLWDPFCRYWDPCGEGLVCCL